MKSAFLDRILERIDKIDPQNLQSQFLRLAREKGLLEAIFQAVHEGIIVLDASGTVAYANRAAERFLGIQTDSALGRPILRYLPEIDWKSVLDLDAGEWSKMINYEVEVNYPERRFLSLYVAPLVHPAAGENSKRNHSPDGASGENAKPGNGTPDAASAPSEDRGLLIMLRDITRDRELEASARESERLNAVKLLAAGVAHEIGNPLNSLNIHLQLMERDLLRLKDERCNCMMEPLQIAKEEVARLDMIITQFLRALRPAKPTLAPHRVEEIIEATLKLLEHDIRNRNIRVEVARTGPVPSIPVDPRQMKQAFFNVIKNALQAMPDGGELSIELSSSDRFARIAFRDTGVGISRKDLSSIFEPYYTTKPDGSGLGMMIVQRIVQDHGGAIEVHSEPDTGTTVSILLPLVERKVRLLKSKSTHAGEPA